LPAQTKLWSSLGPFPAEDAAKAYTTAFEPEKDVKAGPLDLKKSYTKVVLSPAAPDKKDGGPPAAKGKAADAPEKAPPPKPKDEGKAEAPKAEKAEKAVPPIPKATDGDKDGTPKAADKKDGPKPPDMKADGKKPRPKPETITWA